MQENFNNKLLNLTSRLNSKFNQCQGHKLHWPCWGRWSPRPAVSASPSGLCSTPRPRLHPPLPSYRQHGAGNPCSLLFFFYTTIKFPSTTIYLQDDNIKRLEIKVHMNIYNHQHDIGSATLLSLINR